MTAHHSPNAFGLALRRSTGSSQLPVGWVQCVGLGDVGGEVPEVQKTCTSSGGKDADACRTHVAIPCL